MPLSSRSSIYCALLLLPSHRGHTTPLPPSLPHPITTPAFSASPPSRCRPCRPTCAQNDSWLPLLHPAACPGPVAARLSRSCASVIIRLEEWEGEMMKGRLMVSRQGGEIHSSSFITTNPLPYCLPNYHAWKFWQVRPCRKTNKIHIHTHTHTQALSSLPPSLPTPRTPPL